MIFENVSNVSKNSEDSLTIAMKILTARKVEAIRKRGGATPKHFQVRVQYVDSDHQVEGDGLTAD